MDELLSDFDVKFKVEICKEIQCVYDCVEKLIIYVMYD